MVVAASAASARARSAAAKLGGQTIESTRDTAEDFTLWIGELLFEQFQRQLQTAQGRRDFVRDIRQEIALAADVAVELRSDPIDGARETAEFVVAAAVEAQVELAGGDTLGGARDPRERRGRRP